MGKLHELFKTNPNLESGEGIVLDYDNRVRIHIRRAGGSNRQYQKVLETVTAPFRRAIDTGMLSQERAEELFMEIFARAVVLRWEGVEQGDLDGSDDTAEVIFNYDNCMKLFHTLPDLFRDIQEAAGKASLFRMQVEEAATKNS